MVTTIIVAILLACQHLSISAAPQYFKCIDNSCGRGCTTSNCAQECAAQNCGRECSGNGCAYKCAADSCGYKCSSDGCAQDCKAVWCGRACSGNGCARRCIGKNCGDACTGANCAVDCLGTNCGNGDATLGRKDTGLACDAYIIKWHCEADVHAAPGCAWDLDNDKCTSVTTTLTSTTVTATSATKTSITATLTSTTTTTTTPTTAATITGTATTTTTSTTTTKTTATTATMPLPHWHKSAINEVSSQEGRDSFITVNNNAMLIYAGKERVAVVNSPFHVRGRVTMTDSATGKAIDLGMALGQCEAKSVSLEGELARLKAFTKSDHRRLLVAEQAIEELKETIVNLQRV